MTPESKPTRAPVTVTGGAGYVGSLVVRLLLEQGDQVRVLDNFLFGSEALSELDTNPSLEIVRGDIRSRDDWDRVLSGSKAVIHLAGLVGDPACGLDPELTKAVNLESTRTLVDAARAQGIERIVFASTCSVYGAAGEAWARRRIPDRSGLALRRNQSRLRANPSRCLRRPRRRR